MSRWPVAGPSEYWLLASSPASKVKKKQCPNSITNTHKITTHKRQLQQYTRSTNNNYTQDNLKLATKDTRQIRIFPVEILCLLRSSTEDNNKYKYTFTATRQYTFMLVSLSGPSALFFSSLNVVHKSGLEWMQTTFQRPSDQSATSAWYLISRGNLKWLPILGMSDCRTRLF